MPRIRAVIFSICLLAPVVAAAQEEAVVEEPAQEKAAQEDAAQEETSQAEPVSDSGLVPLFDPAAELPPAEADGTSSAEATTAKATNAEPDDAQSSPRPQSSARSDGGLVPLFDPNAAPAPRPEPSVANAPPAPSQPPTTSSGGLVPLFDPGAQPASGAQASAGAGAASTWQQPDADPRAGAGAGRAGSADPGLVPLFDPGGAGGGSNVGGRDSYNDPYVDSYGASRSTAFDDPFGGTEPRTLDDQDFGFDDTDSGEPPLYDPRAAENFDYEAARQLLSSEMTTPDVVLPVESALEPVAPDEIDGELGAASVRGANELGLDLRSIERFHWQCGNEVGRRDVTLFANGTVRLREGPRAQRTMQLDELAEEQLLDYLSRLSRIQRSRELRHDVAGGEDFGQVDGDFGESCTLRLRLPDLPPMTLRMPRLEVPQLGVAQLLELADELAAFTRPLDRPSQVRTDYKPQTGDHLRRKDGHYFRVVGVTDDGAGVELEGLQEPIRVFYRLADLPLLFNPADGAVDTSPAEASEPEVREIVDFGGGS